MSTDFTEDPAGVDRRTIMAGAAWTIPAIALAAAAPAQALSGPVSLAFDKPSYAGTLCSAISGAYVTVTSSGAPMGQQSVTVAVSSGFAFENGLSTYSGVSGSDGKVAVPTVLVKTASATGTLTASASGVSVSSPLTAPAATTTQTGRYRSFNGSGAENSGAAGSFSVPTGARVVGPLSTLDPDGTLRRLGGQAATNVTSAVAAWDHTGELAITYVYGSKAAYKLWDTNGNFYAPASGDFATVNPGALAVGPRMTLDTTRVFRLFLMSNQAPTGVTSAVGSWYSTGEPNATYVYGTKAAYGLWGTDGTFYPPASGDFDTVDSRTRAVGPRMILDSTGALRLSGSPISSGVTSVVGEWNNSGQLTATYIDGTGGHYRQWQSNGTLISSANVDFKVTAGAKVVGPRTTLDSSQVLRYLESQVDTGVSSAASTWTTTGDVQITYVNGAC